MSPVRRAVFVVAIVGVAATTTSLGRWQLRRLAARKANNRVQLHARASPPLTLPGPLVARDSGRHAVARGHFDTTANVLVRERVRDDAPGLYVVTPFALDGTDSVVWVERGFVASPDAATPVGAIPAPVMDDTVVDGLLVPAPSLPDSGRPITRAGVTTWAHIDAAALRRLRPRSLAMTLLLSGDEHGPGRLPTIAPPELSNGPHLSYAIQWFGMALAVLVFGVLILWKGDRPLPKDRAAP